MCVHLAIPGGALALIIAWHAAQEEKERRAGHRALGNGKWETECQQFMKWTRDSGHGAPPATATPISLAFPAHWGHNQTVIGAGNDFAN